MNWEFLPDSDSPKVERRSSTRQFEGLLSVQMKGEFVPILFDMIDGIDCDKVITHKIAIALEPWVGYYYPIKECNYQDVSVFFAQDSTPEIKVLPEWFGEGLYEDKGVKNVIPTGDDGGMLGISQDKTLRVGLDYVQSKSPVIYGE